MKYMLLIHTDPSARSNDPALAEKMTSEYMTFSQEIAESGELAAGDALQGPDTATVVRVRGTDTTITDGPFVETKEHLGGFAVVDVADDAAARYWAGRIAMAVGWPQEVHRFPHRAGVLADHQAEAASSGR